MSAFTITIPTRPKEAGENLQDLQEAILEVKLLIFERRAIDLDEKQTYALFVLTDLQQRIQKGGAQ